jgi:hypothetical protein
VVVVRGVAAGAADQGVVVAAPLQLVGAEPAVERVLGVVAVQVVALG